MLEILLGLLAMFSLAAIVVGALGFWRLRAKRPAVAIPSDSSVLPAAIELIPSHEASWMDPDAVRVALRSLIQLGFEKLGVYQVAEPTPVQIGVLARSEDGTCAVLTEQGPGELWCDFLAAFSDGSALIASNSPLRRIEPEPPTQCRILVDRISIGKLHQLFVEALAEERFKEVTPIDRASFRSSFEEIHKSAIAWYKANASLEDDAELVALTERDAADDARCTPVFEAIAAQDLNRVDELLREGLPLTGKDPRGWTPLLAAVATGQVELVQRLLEAGAAVNAAVGDRCWPSRASYLLLDSPGSESDAKETDAADAVEAKAPRGTQVEFQGGIRALTPLMAAVEAGCLDLIRLLLAAGAEVDGAGRCAPLSIAAREGDPEVVQLLIEAGARLDARDEVGRTPLMNACVAGFLEVATLLLEAGAEVEVEGEEGETALLCAAESGSHELLELLAPKVSEPALRVARRVCAEHDLTEGHRRRDSQVRRLFEAASKGRLSAVEKLLAEGVAADASEEEDSALQVTPLMAAAEAGELEVMARLIEAGADVNRVAEGRSVIFRVLAAVSMPRDRREAALEVLVHAGADLGFIDPQGRKAVKIAWESEDPGLVKVIERLQGHRG